MNDENSTSALETGNSKSVNYKEKIDDKRREALSPKSLNICHDETQLRRDVKEPLKSVPPRPPLKMLSEKPPKSNKVVPEMTKDRRRERSNSRGFVRSSSTSSLQRLSGIRACDSDDASSVGSVMSSKSTQSTPRVRARSASRDRSKANVPGVGKGIKKKSRIRSAPSTPTGERNQSRLKKRTKAVSSGKPWERFRTNSSWTEQQRKAQADRKKRSTYDSRSGERDDLVLEELQKSHTRLTQTGVSNKRPRALKAVQGSKNESEATDEGTSQNVSLTSKSPISTFRKVAAGLRVYSPKKSTLQTPKPTKSGNSTPLSYSKVVKLGSTPQFIRKLFDEKNKNVLEELDRFESDNLQHLSLELFGEGTGISDEEIRKILNARPTKADKWELKTQVKDTNHALKVLKATTNSLMKGKNSFVKSAIGSMITATTGFNRAVEVAREFEVERRTMKERLVELESENIGLKDDHKDKDRELGVKENKSQYFQTEIDTLKAQLNESQKMHTQISIALEVEKAQRQEAAKTAERWRMDISNMEAGKIEAVKEAEAQISYDLERDKGELQIELAALKNEMKSRTEDLCRCIDIDGSSSDIDLVKRSIYDLKTRTRQLESELQTSQKELSRAITETETLTQKVSSKDNMISEMTKGFQDMQRSGQHRETEANDLRREAEHKASELDRKLAEVKGENTVLQYEKANLQEHLNESKEKLSALQSENEEFQHSNTHLQNAMKTDAAQLLVEKQLRDQERNERIAMSAQMVAMTKEHAQVEAQLREFNESKQKEWLQKQESMEANKKVKEEKLVDANEVIAGLRGEINSLKQTLQDQKSQAQAESAEKISSLTGEINMLNERIRASEQNALSTGVANAEQVKRLEEQMDAYHVERRRMHNTIQELRGNVRVFARVRPFLPGDGGDNEHNEASVIPTGTNSLKLLLDGNPTQDHTFTFDRVFPPSSGQENVFSEVSEFVQSALDGYSVCLFSYGQTGSGKTHTMQGSGVGQMRGIIPRAIEQVGERKKLLEKDGWKYDMKVSFVEIYNESIRDLLREEKSDEKKHEIKMDSNGRRFITDINTVCLEPSDRNAVDNVMRQAAKHRSVGCTSMNSTSSRSHSIFTLYLKAIHLGNRQELCGQLNLVDLAGSERLDRSNATGGTAKETVSINKSLSSLADVFVSIGKKASHIPFRNSKLTYLLQPCLSGDGKTLMLVNLSPTELSSQESLCSLRFASKVNKCELGKAKCSMKELREEKPTNPNSSIKKVPKTGGPRTTSLKRTISSTPKRHVRARPI